jgi:hypothetical protein
MLDILKGTCRIIPAGSFHEAIIEKLAPFDLLLRVLKAFGQLCFAQHHTSADNDPIQTKFSSLMLSFKKFQRIDKSKI